MVMNVAGSKRQQAIKIDLALEGIPILIDVIVVTPEEVEKYRGCIRASFERHCEKTHAKAKTHKYR